MHRLNLKKNRLLEAVGGAEDDENLQMIMMSDKVKQGHLKRIKERSARAKLCIHKWVLVA